MIGMVLLQPGYEADYDGAPPVYEVGCAGLITHVERLADGRFNIVLRGLGRFRIASEDPPSSTVLYRRALVTPLSEVNPPDRNALLRDARQKLEALLAPLFSGTLAARGLPQQMPDDELINALAQYLELEPIEKQALLERDGALQRCQSLVELLEMKALMEKGMGGASHRH
jgi:Lon protease-like protein